MEKYLGVKLIEAELAKGYNNKLYLGQGIPVGDSLQEGYKVVYEDGYTSWSPKDTFEKAYRKIKTLEDLLGIVAKKDYQIRVIEEAEDLQDKILLLEIFITSNNIYKELSIDEQIRLKQQLMAMQYYLTILVERIENF